MLSRNISLVWISIWFVKTINWQDQFYSSLKLHSYFLIFRFFSTVNTCITWCTYNLLLSNSHHTLLFVLTELTISAKLDFAIFNDLKQRFGSKKKIIGRREITIHLMPKRAYWSFYFLPHFQFNRLKFLHIKLNESFVAAVANS